MIYDPVEWRQLHDDLLARLPDPQAAEQIRRATDRVLQARAAGMDAFETVTADQILNTQYPDPVWAVPGLLPAGLAILAGRPKLGKSWLALQLAQSVAAGGVFLGERAMQGRVLYLALEDSPRRLKSRMQQQHWQPGLPVDFITLETFGQVGALTDGGAERLANKLAAARYTLVVVDTFSRSIEGDQNDVTSMTNALAPLQAVAHEQNCVILLIDHHSKGLGAEIDVVSDVLGSTGKGAVVDSVLGLYRERGKLGAKLAVTGRDVEERTIQIMFDHATGCWQVLSQPDRPALSPGQQSLLAILEELDGATLSDLVAATGKNKGNLSKALKDLVNIGRVTLEGRVYRVVP